MSSSKPQLAFCYILGDDVPMDLEKAVDLFTETAVETNMANYLSDFMLSQLIDLRVLLELHKQKKDEDIKYILGDPERRKTFTEITGIWQSPTADYFKRMELAERWQRSNSCSEGNDLYYDSSRLKTLNDVWERLYCSNYSANKCYYSPGLLKWVRYYCRNNGISKDELIQSIRDSIGTGRNGRIQQMILYNHAFISLLKLSLEGVSLL